MATAYGFRPASPCVTVIDCLCAIDLPRAGSFPGAARLTRCADDIRLVTNVADPWVTRQSGSPPGLEALRHSNPVPGDPSADGVLVPA